MAPTNKRDWFATGESEDEADGYDSEVAEESKGRSFGARSTKRRKVDQDDFNSEDEQSDAEDDAPSISAKDAVAEEDEVPEEEEEAEEDENARPKATAVKTSLGEKERARLQRRAAKEQARIKRTGVIYVSRIPPFMKPHTLKHMLKPFAPSGLDRIFLTPEDPTTRSSRVKSGGNKKKTFLDGWVEFASRHEAKRAAETLNGQNIGGKKGNYYYDDVWNLKYLKNFKWRNLTEAIANENAEREARLRAETQRERKEAREFLRNVERAKVLDGMERKRKQKKMFDDDGQEAPRAVNKSKDDSGGSGGMAKMEFKQTAAVSKAKKHTQGEGPSADAQRVLSKIF